MHRCVVLHRNATSELQDVQPALHQKLRHLDYKRFVLEFVRDADGLSSTAPLYCQFTPSPWQASNAAKQLWGRRSGNVRLFDEDGHLVQDATTSTGTPMHGMPAVPAPAAPSVVEATAATAATADTAITSEDVELVGALARFVEESAPSSPMFRVVPREVVVARVRALAQKLSAKMASGDR